MNDKQVAEYLEDITSELSCLAERSGHGMVSYYLALASAEASEIVKSALQTEDADG